MRFIDLFDRSAERFPDRVCAIDDDKEITYREAEATSRRLAARIIEEGLAVEAKIGIMSSNIADVVPVILGVVRSGCTWLPVNARNSHTDNVEILTNNDCEWLFFESGYEAEAGRLRDALPQVRGAVCIDRAGMRAPGLHDWISGANEDAPERGLDIHHCFKMALSGGTTGTPKGVMHTNLNAQIFISSLTVTFPHKQIPRFLCIAPVTHAAGNFCMWILSLGGTLVMMRKPDAGNIIASITRHRITTTFAPSTLLYSILDDPQVLSHEYETLEYFFYGAAPTSAEKLRQAINVFGMKMAQVYSLAEATMAMTYMTPADHEVLDDPDRIERLKSAGRPAPYTRIEILDDDGHPVPIGALGEIAVRGETISRGYYKRPDETAAMMKNGWLMTSDVGYRDADGFIYLVDRKRDMIITGGFNVYPSEVERVIGELPGVHDVAVIGVPDEKWGEAVAAVVVRDHGANIGPEEVMSYCKTQLGSVKAPKRVDFWEALPKSPNGKVLKRKIREHYWTGVSRSLTA